MNIQVVVAEADAVRHGFLTDDFLSVGLTESSVRAISHCHTDGLSHRCTVTQIYCHTDRLSHRWTVTQTDCQTDRQTVTRMDCHRTDCHTDFYRQTDCHTEKQTVTQTDCHTDRQTVTQTDCQTDRQTVTRMDCHRRDCKEIFSIYE